MIDLDFESLRRGEIKEYVFNKYGREYVCEIGSYGRMLLRTAIVDFGKQFGLQQKDLLAITTTLEKEDAQSLEAALESSPKLRSIMDDHDGYESAVKSVIGQIKSQSVHPAGLLICSERLDSVTPLKTQKTSKGESRVIVTQAEDKHVIAQGLVKMDILGLKEYDIFKFAIESAASLGCELTVDNYIDTIHDAEVKKPDKEVWDKFKTGETSAVFQFGSPGMRQLLIDMKADNIGDLIAAVALYRPGCIANGWHTLYCKRKHGEEPVEYIHPVMEEILKDTYGVCVFQEQFMEIFNKMGDIPLTDADIIRSALGKKDDAKLAKFEKRFIAGASKKISPEKASELWNQLKQSAGYNFNKSHSAVYAIVAYISQWLKVHHPVGYWTAVVDWNCRKKDPEMLLNKRSAAEQGVIFNMPDINQSKVHFIVDLDNNPRWSFSGIAGLGEKTAERIVSGQPFSSVTDFLKRSKGVNFNNKLSLAYAGAFDSFDDRKVAVKTIYDSNKKKKAPKLTNSHMLFEYSRALGFFDLRLSSAYPAISKKCFTEQQVKETEDKEPVVCAGMVSEVKRIKTKNGDMMAKVFLVDYDERFELTVFPKPWSVSSVALRVGAIVQVDGVKSNYGGKHQIEVRNVEIIESGNV